MTMNSLDYLHLCDALNVTQAALLIVGVDPSTAQDLMRSTLIQA